MSITTQCMVANLSISLWTGQRLDKEASRKVTDEANAANDAARVNKHLVPKEALKPIIAAQSALRGHFYENTLPWRDNGDRLLTRKRFQTFIAEHGGLKAAFDEAVDDFIDNTYLQAREQAAFRMGALFKPDDYPLPSTLRRRFAVALDIDAVTEAGDFRVQMDADAAERVRAGMESAMQERLGRAMKDVWIRLAEAVGHVADRLKDPETVFRNSLIENLTSVVDMVPDLNVLDDPDIARLTAEVKAKLTGYTPEDLRADKDMRAEAATIAQDIYAEIGGLMRAFSGNP